MSSNFHPEQPELANWNIQSGASYKRFGVYSADYDDDDEKKRIAAWSVAATSSPTSVDVVSPLFIRAATVGSDWGMRLIFASTY